MNFRALRGLWNDERGVALGEYALVLAIFGIGMIVAFGAITVAAGAQYDTTSTNLTNVGVTPP